MRAWQINSLIVLGVIGLMLIPESILPNKFYQPLVLSIVVGTSWWAYEDAGILKTENFKKTFISPFTSPFGIAAFCFLMWIIGFPLYVSFRQRILENKMPVLEPEEN